MSIEENESNSTSTSSTDIQNEEIHAVEPIDEDDDEYTQDSLPNFENENQENELQQDWAELEANLNAELQEFNQINEEIDNRLEEIEEEHEADEEEEELPTKRVRTQTSRYIPTHKGKSYNYQDEKIFAHVLFHTLSQYTLKAGIKKFGERGVEAVRKELRQMHLCESFVPKFKTDLTFEE